MSSDWGPGWWRIKAGQYGARHSSKVLHGCIFPSVARRGPSFPVTGIEGFRLTGTVRSWHEEVATSSSAGLPDVLTRLWRVFTFSGLDATLT